MKGVLGQLSPVSRKLTNLSLTFGGENTVALADMTTKLRDYNIELMGAPTSVYANRIGGFAGAVRDYQDALMQYRQGAMLVFLSHCLLIFGFIVVFYDFVFN